MTSDAAILREALRAVAPGTPLREGLERIQRSHTGALIVLGYTPEIQAMCSGGFDLDVAFTAARLRELCKMDGAVIIDPDLWRIRKANVQLFPDPTIPTDESGMRHRTAQRTARQTHLPVLSLSASMRMISIYVGTEHRLVEEPEALLSRANLAVDTLDRYSQRLDEVLQTLTILEMRDSATVRDVATVMQRMEMIRRITSEITEYLEELGSEGRLRRRYRSHRRRRPLPRPTHRRKPGPPGPGRRRGRRRLVIPHRALEQRRDTRRGHSPTPDAGTRPRPRQRGEHITELSGFPTEHQTGFQPASQPSAPTGHQTARPTEARAER